MLVPGKEIIPKNSRLLYQTIKCQTIKLKNSKNKRCLGNPKADIKGRIPYIVIVN